ncbi:MAG: peptidoglycan DD-metalloendopeptidase family protein [Tannerellaceae bacterium]|jgi:septal ring factor EnvC (AmiA/AmiB activator)|nr:peptidoglycan DD-metalloendopeptidase family protein [Tannerellaceae bacterium]
MKLFLIIIAILITIPIQGQKSTQVRELESQRKAIEKEIETTSQLLAETQESTQRSLARLELFSKQIEQRRTMIRLLSQEISVTDKDIQGQRNEIIQLEKELNYKREKYSEALRLIQKKRHTQDKLLFIFSAANFAQSIRRIKYLKEYAAWQKQQAKGIISKQKSIQSKRSELEQAKDEKQKLLLRLETEKQKIEEEELEQKNEIEALNRRQRELQSELARKQRRAEILNRQIEKQIAEEVARAAAEAKASKELAEQTGSQPPKENRREADNAGGYAMTKEERELSETFAAAKGTLASPLSKPYAIISDYGEQQHPNLRYVRIMNHGIDLQTSSNAEACAVFTGVVRAIFIVEPGFSIIVRHGKYLTVYSNLSEVYVHKDDAVKTGQRLGKVYADIDNGNASIMHFELWQESDKQNPRPWLGR